MSRPGPRTSREGPAGRVGALAWTGAGVLWCCIARPPPPPGASRAPHPTPSWRRARRVGGSWRTWARSWRHKSAAHRVAFFRVAHHLPRDLSSPGLRFPCLRLWWRYRYRDRAETRPKELFCPEVTLSSCPGRLGPAAADLLGRAGP